jgi:hypothetical protein
MTFEELLREHSIPTAPEGHHHVTHGFVGIDCPYCSPNSRRFRMGYSRSGRFVSCWGCGYHPLAETLSELTGLTLKECFNLLGEVETERRTRRPEHAGRLVLPERLGPLLKPHLSYLAARHFDPDALTRLWGVRGIGMSYKLTWRIFIPVILNGDIVSWTTRATTDETARRYVSAPLEHEKIHHKRLLYGEDYARNAIVVHEGPTDVWRTGPGAVATFGMVVSRAQVARMTKHPVRVVCFDSDADAQKRARELCDVLKSFPGQTVNIVLDAKDAGSASVREIARLRRSFLDA